MLNTLNKLWLRVQEPRALSAIYFFAYIAVAVLGLAVAYDPPRTIQSALGHTLMVAWGWMLLVGGGVGAATVLQGVWWLERAGALLCMGAIGVYGIAICYLPITQWSIRIATVCFFIIPFLAFTARLVKIRHYAYDPEK